MINSEAPFDASADRYDDELSLGLRLTGEAKDYYIKGRIARLSALLGAAFPRRILDYGCGTGSAVPALSATFSQASIVGTDPSSASLAIARQYSPAADFVELTEFIAAGPFDLCHCNGVFHHIAPSERDRYLEAILESMAPGGYLAFFENNPLNPGTRLVMSRIPFDRDAIPLTAGEGVERLKRVGFSVCSVEYLFYFPRQLRLLRPIECLLYRVPFGAQYLILAQKKTSA